MLKRTRQPFSFFGRAWIAVAASTAWLFFPPFPSFVGTPFPTQRTHRGEADARHPRRAVEAVAAGGVVLGTSVALVLGYDWALRKDLEKSYLEMRVVDALINEDMDEMMQRIQALGKSEGDLNEAGWTRLFGVESFGKATYQSEDIRIAGKDSTDLVIDGKSWADGLGELLARRWSETGGVVSNTGARLAWEREIQAAEDAASEVVWPSGTSTWAFEFRSYTNQEELNAMLAAKPGLQQLLLRPANRTSLKVEGETAELEDNFVLLGGLLQVKIRWRGKVLSLPPTLRWDTSEAVLSSSIFLWLQRTFDRPAAAERLRQDPWQLMALVEPTVVGKKRAVAVLKRRGAGRLVFMKQ